LLRCGANDSPLPGVNKPGKNVEGMPMLQVPLEIAFHNVEPQQWAEEEIRAKVAALEKRFERLISCRVRIDKRVSDRAGTIPPVVRIELGVPGRGEIVVSHEPDRLLRKYQRPDLHRAINEAFRVAERRLTDLKELRGNREKAAAARGSL
jgi:ribosome-associated translation inhibitor RaiA